MKAGQIFDLSGRVAVVTGASSGLGRRFAEVLAANGAAVALVARRTTWLHQVKDGIERAGGRALVIEADVTEAHAPQRVFDAVQDVYGIVDILVNNAGAAQSVRAAEMTPEEWRRILALNLDAVFAWAQEAGRRMLAAQTQGAIINIASVLGLGVAKGTSAYATSKAAVIQLTRALAEEWTFKGVRVNAIAPGWFVTDLNRDFLAGEAGDRMKRAIPAGRFGAEGDLDGALLLLASRAGAYISGETLVVDGGQSVGLRS